MDWDFCWGGRGDDDKLIFRKRKADKLGEKKNHGTFFCHYLGSVSTVYINLEKLTQVL